MMEFHNCRYCGKNCMGSDDYVISGHGRFKQKTGFHRICFQQHTIGARHDRTK